MSEEHEYSEITDEIKLLIKELQLNFKIIKERDEDFLIAKKIFHKKTKLFFRRNDLAIDFFAEIIDEKILYKIFPHVDIFNLIIENFIEKNAEEKILFFLKHFNFQKSKMKFKLIASLIFRDRSLKEFDFTNNGGENRMIILTSFFKNTVRFLRYIFKYLHDRTVLSEIYDLFMQLNIFTYIFTKKHWEIILLLEEIMRINYAHNLFNFTENIFNYAKIFHTGIEDQLFEEENINDQAVEIHRRGEKKAYQAEKRVAACKNIIGGKHKKNFNDLLTVFMKTNFKYLIFQRNENEQVYFPAYLLTHYLLLGKTELEIYIQDKFYGEENSLPFTEENIYEQVGDAVLKYDHMTFNETLENNKDNFTFLYFLIHIIKNDLIISHVELIDMKKYRVDKLILIAQIYFYKKINISNFLTNEIICDLYSIAEREGSCRCSLFKQFNIHVCISCTIFTVLSDIFTHNFTPIHFRISHIFIIYNYAKDTDRHVFIKKYMKKFLQQISGDSFLYGKIFLMSKK